MAEAIGLIASLVTIATFVNDGIKRAKALYQAAEELELATDSIANIDSRLMKEQIEDFTSLLDEIDRQPTASISTTISTSLSRAKLTLEQLDQIVKNKLLRNANGGSRARRRAWVRNKSKICNIQNALKEHRLNLLAAMGTTNLTSNTRSEAMSRSLDRRLCDIQQSLTKTHHAVMSQKNTVNCILGSLSRDPTDVRCLNGQWPLRLWSLDTGYMETGLDNCTSQDQAHVTSTQQISRSAAECGRGHQRFLSPGPATLLEASPNFFPEIYTNQQRIPQSSLLIIKSHETTLSCEYKTTLYRALYMKSHRQWCRLSISIKFHRFSIYWHATKASQYEYNARETTPLVGHASLPNSLSTKIKLLLQTEDLAENGELQFALTADNSTYEQNYKSNPFSSFTTAGYSSTGLNILGFLDDLGCPRFCENEVTQVELLDPPRSFVSCIGGTLVYEIKFVNSGPSCELLYTIRVLHCMDGRFGFAKLVGVVVDKIGKRLKSYLIEFPKAQRSLLRALGDPSIQWGHRERWAKQLVEGICQLHSKGFVAGTLCSGRSPVVLDDSNTLKFWYLKSKFHVGRPGTNDYYPPEFQHLEKLSRTISEDECPALTSKTDIFHLGLLLWLLAENSSHMNTRPWCIRERCNVGADLCCDKSHSHSIVLPELPKSVPTYYREIVNACRAHDPNARPAARRLLECFPPLGESELIKHKTPDPESTDLTVVGGSLIGTVNCDKCRSRYLRLPFFHCNTCETGDFDLCRACYAKGIHCYDDAHLLVEMRKVAGLIVPGTYHSCVKSLGERDIIEL